MKRAVLQRGIAVRPQEIPRRRAVLVHVDPLSRPAGDPAVVTIHEVGDARPPRVEVVGQDRLHESRDDCVEIDGGGDEPGIARPVAVPPIDDQPRAGGQRVGQ